MSDFLERMWYAFVAVLFMTLALSYLEITDGMNLLAGFLVVTAVGTTAEFVQKCVLRRVQP